MRFEHEVIGYPVYLDISTFSKPNSVSWQSPELPGRRFNDLDELTKALRLQDLQSRKNFSNTEAYMLNRNDRYRVSTVTVTSVGGREAWIKHDDGKRNKVRLSELYADKNQVTSVAAQCKEHDAAKDVLLGSLIGWQPE